MNTLPPNVRAYAQEALTCRKTNDGRELENALRNLLTELGCPEIQAQFCVRAEPGVCALELLLRLLAK